jgi:hypothetical protein
VGQRDVPARDLNGVIKHHTPAIIVSGFAAEIQTGRPIPNIRQKFLTEETCAVLALYVHILTKRCFVQLSKWRRVRWSWHVARTGEEEKHKQGFGGEI